MRHINVGMTEDGIFRKMSGTTYPKRSLNVIKYWCNKTQEEYQVCQLLPKPRDPTPFWVFLVSLYEGTWYVDIKANLSRSYPMTTPNSSFVSKISWWNGGISSTAVPNAPVDMRHCTRD